MKTKRAELKAELKDLDELIMQFDEDSPEANDLNAQRKLLVKRIKSMK